MQRTFRIGVGLAASQIGIWKTSATIANVDGKIKNSEKLVVEVARGGGKLNLIHFLFI